MTVLRRLLPAAAGLLLSGAACAQGFSALVTPPRFEDVAQAGTTYRNVIEIANVSDRPARYAIKTNDWTLDESASAHFDDALAPGSCRPWVGIEAPVVSLPANGKRRYRFEVAVPADAPAGECRFAIMVEGDTTPAPGAVPVPVAGRIAVIVYLTLGDASAKFDIVGSGVEKVDGQDRAVLRVRNTGNAHGRMDGLLEGRDASGRTFAFAPSNQPILPGETRAVVLTPQADSADAAAPVIAWPLALKGQMEWGALRIPVDATVRK